MITPDITNVVNRTVNDTDNTAGNTPTATGNFGVSDVDNNEGEGGSRAPTYAILSGTGGNAATVSGSNITKGGTTWGTMSLNTATGAWTFTANAAALNTLHDGETEILSLQARVTDAAGATDTETFTITLTGANDNPDITNVVNRTVSDTANTASNTPTATGNFGVTDPDNNEGEGGSRAPTYAILSGTGGNAATATTSDTGTTRTYTITKSSVTWGTISLNINTGAWTFTANAAALNSLDAGESERLVLRARVTDEESATDTGTFTITLNGAADAPTTVLTDADGGSDAQAFSVTETTSSSRANIATITVTDPDTDYATSAFTISDNRFEVAKSANVFTLRIKSGQAFDFDESAADNTFTFTVSGPGLASTTFTGTIINDPADDNQAPTLTTTTTTGAVTEDSATTATGRLTFGDADSGDTRASLIISTGSASSTPRADITANHNIPGNPSADTDAAAGTAPADIVGTYGTFSFTRNNNNGALNWTYTLDSTDPVVQALRAGQQAYEKLAVSVTDDDGATSTTRVITVTITGVNDDPDIGGDGAAQASALVHGVRFTVNTFGTASWKFNFATTTAGSRVVQRGSSSITLSFNNVNTRITSREVLDLWNTEASNDLLRAISAALEGTAQEDSLTNLVALEAIAVTGGSSGDLNFTIDDTENSEDNTPSVSGDFEVTDPDNGEQEGGSRAPTYSILSGNSGTDDATATSSGSGNTRTYTITKGTGGNAVTWGTISLNINTGVWTFTANAASLNSLDSGESEDLVLRARVTDEAGGTDTAYFTITLNGADEIDPLVLAASSDDTGNAYKGDSGVADTGQLTLDETGGPSPTGTLGYGGTNGVYSGTYGTLTIDSTGKWSYALTSDDDALDTAGPGASFDDGETLTDTFSVTITDGGSSGSGAAVTFDLTITIGGRDEISGTNNQDAAVTGTADDEIIQGGGERDTITTGGGNDLVIGGYGDDDITLGTGAQTVVHRYASTGTSSRIDDGGDSVNDFELGVDKLLLVDTDATAHDTDGFITFVTGSAGTNISLVGALGSGYTGIKFVFGSRSKQDGPDGEGDATGLTLTVNFSATVSGAEMATALGGFQNLVGVNLSAAALANFDGLFTNDTFEVIDDADLNLDIL